MDDLNMDLFVSRFYEMQPATDELLPNGRNLTDGMCVLIDDQNLRQSLNVLMHPDNTMYEEILYKARESNRWCIVSELEILDHLNFQVVVFTACYPDGLRRQRIVPLEKAWLVKADSIPSRDPEWVAKTLGEAGRRLGLDDSDVLEEVLDVVKTAASEEIDVLRRKLAEVSSKPAQVVEIEGEDSRLIQFDGGSFWFGTSSGKPEEYTEAELVRMPRDEFEKLRERDAARRPPGKVVDLKKLEEDDEDTEEAQD